MTDPADNLNTPTPPPPEASRREEEDKPTIFLGSSIFEAMLFSLRVLTANDKRKMTEAIEKGITPPEGDLAGFYTVYRHATKEEKNKMLEAIATPPPEKPPVPDADAANNRAILTLLRLMAKPSRDHIAAALDSGLDSLTKEELFAHGQLVAMVTCTEGEHDAEIADVLGISLERIAALRARELATPPEQEDFFRDPIAQKKEEARRKIRRVFPISQTAGYNALLSITPKNSDLDGEKKTVTKNGKEINIVSVTLTKKNRRGETKLTLEKKRETDAKIEEQYEAAASCWRTSAKKMLDYSVIKLTEKNPHIKRGSTVDIREIDTLVSWSLEDWCKLRDKPLTESSIEHERVRAKEDCETLVGTHFAWSTRGKGGFKQFTFMNPLQTAEVKGGQVTIRLSQDFSRYLLEAPVSPYRRKMLSTDERNPNAYALARKLGDFANIKDNSDRRRKIPIENQYKIGVLALIECTSIPKPEAVENGDYRQRIVTPFLIAMEEAERVLDIDWGFVSDIEESQIIDKIPPKRIEDFMSAYIVYSFKDCETPKETENP